MDSSRGVLLAERPAAINYMTNHSVEAAQSVNFKGVMLSNRPPDASESQHRHAAFRIRNTEEKIHPAGRDTDYMNRMEQQADRPRPPTLADGVKRGLEILAARKRALQHAAAEAEMHRLQRRARFTESQRQVREAIISQAIIVEEEEEPSGSASAAYTRISAPARVAEATGGDRKPAWARSAAAQEEEDEDEADELLAFVGGFNPDSYEGELEEGAGQALLAVQIAEVEAEEGRGKAELAALEADEAGSVLRAEAAAAARSRRDARLAARRAAAQENKKEGEEEGEYVDSEGGYGSEDEGEDIDAGPGELPRRTRARGGDDAGSIADSVLSSTSARAVHSKRSMANVVERTQRDERMRIAAALAEGDATRASSIALPVLVPPVIAEYNDMRGALEKNKGLVSLLPYQHRNPAV